MPVEHDPFAEPSVAADLAKSGGIGVAKGVIGLPGLIGDLQSLIRHYGGKIVEENPFDRWAREIEEAHPEWAAQSKALYEKVGRHHSEVGSNEYPTSADIQRTVEPLTGAFYEPQTRAGHYAQTVGEFVPMALTGGEGIAANLLKGAVAPGLASEAAGERTKGTWLELPARVIGGLFGGGAAHATQAGYNTAKTAGAARSAAGEASQLLGEEIPAGAVSRVAKDVRNDALTPQSAAARVQELGPEAMLLDTGRQLQGRAEAIATQPGAGQNRVLNAVENRTGTFGDATAQRIKDTLNREMGQAPDVVAAQRAVERAVDQQAKPLYDQVMADHPVVDVPSDITNRPAVKQAMGDAISLARNYGEKLSQPAQRTVLNAGGVPITQTIQQPAQTSLRYWDYVKKALDSNINGMLKTGGIQKLDSAEKQDLGGLIAARNALRDHLDNVTGGAYADARRVAAAKPQLTEALDQGREALRTTLLPEELRDIHDNYSIPQQAMLRMGMRREVERIIDTARNDGAAARRILDTNQNREKISAIFGQRAADAIDRRIGAETTFQEATNKIAANSRTGVRQQLVKDTESPSAAAAPVANITGYLHKGVTGALQNLRETGMERTRTGIGSLVTAPGSQVPDLVRILAGYNARAAANSRPPVGPYASTLARVLAQNAINRKARELAGVSP